MSWKDTCFDWQRHLDNRVFSKGDAVVCIAEQQLPTHTNEDLCFRQDSKEHSSFFFFFFALCSDFTITVKGGDFYFALHVSRMQKKQVAENLDNKQRNR